VREIFNSYYVFPTTPGQQERKLCYGKVQTLLIVSESLNKNQLGKSRVDNSIRPVHRPAVSKQTQYTCTQITRVHQIS